jgi:hypothetical protein
MSNSILKRVLNLETNILSLKFLKKNEFTMIGLWISFSLCNYLMGPLKIFFIMGILTGQVIFFNKKLNKYNIKKFEEHLMVNLDVHSKSEDNNDEDTSLSNSNNDEDTSLSNSNNDEDTRLSNSNNDEDTRLSNSNNDEEQDNTSNNDEEQDNTSNNDESSDGFDNCLIKTQYSDSDSDENKLSKSFIHNKLNINDSYIDEKSNLGIRTRSMSQKND